MAQVQATPWSLHERPEVEVRFREPAAEQADAPGATRQASLRQMQISKADLDKYEYTVGCPQCRHFEEYGVSKPGGVHTALCRARLVEEMGKDAPGRARFEAYDTNVNRSIAERIRDADTELAERRAAPPADAPPGSMPGSSNDHLRADGRSEVLGGAPHKMARVRLDEFRENKKSLNEERCPNKTCPEKNPAVYASETTTTTCS